MRAVITAFVIIIFASCAKDEVVIKKKEFTDILIDLHLADAILDIKSFDFREDDGHWDYYTSIFKKHNTNKDEFRTSLEYYIGKPEQFDDIYDDVIIRLEKLKEEAAKESEKSQQKILEPDLIEE
ncbi:MAG: DUF4296 domain-containing protein [Bacteroidales bacterium]|jgi:hypothetical protein|nr:DUF4296 domain-containing protein [Bacteroidales bacterium]